MTADAKGEGMELLPCPLCNSVAEAVHGYPNGLEKWWIQCCACGISTKSHASHVIVASEWNTRPSPSQVVPPPGYYVAPCNSCHGAKLVWDHAYGVWGAQCDTCQRKGVQYFPPVNVAFAELREKFGDDFNGATRVSDEPSQAVMVTDKMTDEVMTHFNEHCAKHHRLQTRMNGAWNSQDFMAMRAALLAALGKGMGK